MAKSTPVRGTMIDAADTRELDMLQVRQFGGTLPIVRFLPFIERGHEGGVFHIKAIISLHIYFKRYVTR